MTNNTVNPFADVGQALADAPDAVDNNVVDNKGFTDDKPAREGPALFRFVSYVETGKHTVEKGKGKGKIQFWADFEFELVHPDHMKGPEDNQFPDTIRLSNINISRNEKAKFYKLFKKMNHTGTAKNFPQLLGQGFLGRLVHNKKDDKVYVNMEEDGQFLIGAPIYNANPDPMGQPDVKDIPVPAAYGDITCFLWDDANVDAPTLQRMWDSIEISGEKADGTPRKNWIQDKIRSNMDWSGSFAESVIDGTDAVAADVSAAVDADVASAVVDPLAAQPAVQDAGSGLVAPNQAAQAEVVDPLAGIAGL